MRKNLPVKHSLLRSLYDKLTSSGGWFAEERLECTTAASMSISTRRKDEYAVLFNDFSFIGEPTVFHLQLASDFKQL